MLSVIKLEHHSRVINYAPRVISKSTIMLLENNYNTDVTQDNRHLQSSYFYSTGHWWDGRSWTPCYKTFFVRNLQSFVKS